MPAPDHAGARADMTRRHGVKETRAERTQRTAAEAREKWRARLQREDAHKLREELAALQRARFRAPQQNERMRLVARMLRDLEHGADAIVDGKSRSAHDDGKSDDATVGACSAHKGNGKGAPHRHREGLGDSDDDDDDDDVAALLGVAVPSTAASAAASCVVRPDDAVLTTAPSLLPRAVARRGRAADDAVQAAAAAERALLRASAGDSDLDEFLDTL